MNPPERHLEAVPDLPPELLEPDVPKQMSPVVEKYVEERVAAEMERRNPSTVTIERPRPAGPNALAHTGPYRRNGMRRRRAMPPHPMSMAARGVIHRRDQRTPRA